MLVEVENCLDRREQIVQIVLVQQNTKPMARRSNNKGREVCFLGGWSGGGWRRFFLGGILVIGDSHDV
jgi:hypothetical protein